MGREFVKLGVNNYNNIFRINNNLAKIVFHDISSANKLIGLSVHTGYEFYIPEMFTTTYGIIKFIDIDISNDELKNNLKSEYEVINVERIKRFNKNEQKLEDTHLMKIAFRSTSIPNSIVLYGGIRKKVEYYLPKPMFCTDCVSYGHTKKRCRNKIKRCPICGENITDNEHSCNGNNCRICLDKHITNSINCEERKIQTEIRNLMTTKKIPYKEAKSKIAKITNSEINSDLTNFPNLSVNTSRLNHIKKADEIIRSINNEKRKLSSILEQIKNLLSNNCKGHPADNDKILMEISNLILLQNSNQPLNQLQIKQ